MSNRVYVYRIEGNRSLAHLCLYDPTSVNNVSYNHPDIVISGPSRGDQAIEASQVN